MGFATHLGPWLLGTVKETTGTTAGTIRNTGATIVAQSATVAMSGNALTASSPNVQLFTVPAGAKILRFDVEVTVAITGNSVSQVALVVGNGSGSNNQLLTTFNLGTSVTKVAQATVDAAMQVALTNNVGTSDYIIYGTFAATTGNPTAGSVVVTCEYVVRNSDGTSVPASA